MSRRRRRSVRPRSWRQTLEGFDLYPAKLIGDTAYGTAEMLNWLVNEHGIEPHIPVFDKSQHADGTFSRDEFAYDHNRDCYICPAGKELRQRQKIYSSAASLRRSERHDALSREQAGFPKLFTEAEVLSERARPKDPALHP
jgi:hypothetical protein